VSAKVMHICWTMDCESSRPNVNNPELGENAMRGFTLMLRDAGWRATLFAIPGDVRILTGVLRDAASEGHEIALHVHPQAEGMASDYLGAFSLNEQIEILSAGLDEFEARLGIKPVSCRPGYCSANDATFPAMARCGIRQASASIPGRRMSELASNWAGAPLFAHYASAHNRFLPGTMDLVEIPISVDWESMIWGGMHPQDLRIEYTDAKNHSFLIDKIMRRQVEEGLPFAAVVILTHNLFRYADLANFRRETMLGMIDAFHRSAARLGVELVGSTISEAADKFRKSMPLA
jgi:peptidoglycan/xylan/chitin deacetylase (PgdA/CDA1 family)